LDYDKYYEMAHQAGKLVEEGKHDEALTILRSLLNDDISDLDKAMMAYNMAVVYEKQGSEEEALAYYDRGVSYERLHSRCFVAEHRAAYLSRIERNEESLRAYQELLPRSYLTEAEKYRFGLNIATLKQLTAD